jgi:hypothetical protein
MLTPLESYRRAKSSAGDTSEQPAVTRRVVSGDARAVITSALRQLRELRRAGQLSDPVRQLGMSPSDALRDRERELEAALFARLRSAESSETRDIDTSEFARWRSFGGVGFEEAFAELLRKNGYSAHTTKVTGDGGLDIVAQRNGKRIIIQCKNWKARVGIDEVQRLYGVFSAEREGAPDTTERWLLGMGGFTNAARIYARSLVKLRLLSFSAIEELAAGVFRHP